MGASHQVDKASAKRIILALLAESGGYLEGEARLNKAYFYAHLHHWRSYRTHLSGHSVVKMPNGPGIHQGNALLSELEQAGQLSLSETLDPWYPSMILQTDEKVELTPEERASIAFGLGSIAGKSARQLSAETHELLGWNRVEMGETIPLALDAMSELDLLRAEESTRLADFAMVTIFGK